MSISGRNRVRGSVVEVYRGTEAESTGGTATVDWEFVGTTRLEIGSVTDEIARKVFGGEARIDCTAIADERCGIEKKDALKVTKGRHVDETFRVEEARKYPNYRELGLARTTETIP